jgi:hypothetical protein
MHCGDDSRRRKKKAGHAPVHDMRFAARKCKYL